VQGIAGEALTDWEDKFVTLNAAGEVTKADAGAGEIVTGVLETGNNADGTIPDGQIVSVCVWGPTMVSADAANDAMAIIMTSADGQAALATTGLWMIGYLIEPADAAGHLAEFMVTGPSFYHTGA